MKVTEINEIKGNASYYVYGELCVPYKNEKGLYLVGVETNSKHDVVELLRTKTPIIREKIMLPEVANLARSIAITLNALVEDCDRDNSENMFDICNSLCADVIEGNQEDIIPPYNSISEVIYDYTYLSPDFAFIFEFCEL